MGTQRPITERSPAGMSTRFKVVLGGATIVVVLLIVARSYEPGQAGTGQAGAALTGSSPTVSDTTTADATAAGPTDSGSSELPWYPVGFEAWDASVAWRWLDSTTCAEAATCWGMDVLARDGCPRSLYVELATADKAGAAMGTASNSADRVQPGDRVRLVFDNVHDAYTAQLTAISCS